MFTIPWNHSNPDTAPSEAAPSIILEYGADGEKCNDREIRICERGMSFKSRWQFELGTELAIAVTYRDSDLELRRADLQGIIAGCEKICRCCYQITLLFLELPKEIHPAISEISSRLKAVEQSISGRD